MLVTLSRPCHYQTDQSSYQVFAAPPHLCSTSYVLLTAPCGIQLHGCRFALLSAAGEVLLPLFFATSGIRTDIGTLDSGRYWAITVAVIVMACFAKFAPTCLMGKLVTKRDWRFCVSLGLLMNTRGLVEIIALNIGLSMVRYVAKLWKQYNEAMMLVSCLHVFAGALFCNVFWIAGMMPSGTYGNAHVKGHRLPIESW